MFRASFSSGIAAQHCPVLQIDRVIVDVLNTVPKRLSRAQKQIYFLFDGRLCDATGLSNLQTPLDSVTLPRVRKTALLGD